jgi:hypothetical protein
MYWRITLPARPALPIFEVGCVYTDVDASNLEPDQILTTDLDLSYFSVTLSTKETEIYSAPITIEDVQLGKVSVDTIRKSRNHFLLANRYEIVGKLGRVTADYFKINGVMGIITIVTKTFRLGDPVD